MAPGILTVVPSFMLIRWLYKDEFSGRCIETSPNRAPICYQGHERSLLSADNFVSSLSDFSFTLLFTSQFLVACGAVVVFATNRHELEEPLEHVEWTSSFCRTVCSCSLLQYMGVIDYIGATFAEVSKPLAKNIVSSCCNHPLVLQLFLLLSITYPILQKYFPATLSVDLNSI